MPFFSSSFWARNFCSLWYSFKTCVSIKYTNKLPQCNFLLVLGGLYLIDSKWVFQQMKKKGGSVCSWEASFWRIISCYLLNASLIIFFLCYAILVEGERKKTLLGRFGCFTHDYGRRRNLRLYRLETRSNS